MTITLNALQKQRRDTASNWTSNNTVLLAGEWGIESDTKKFKIGDGTTAWQSLDYIPIPDINRLLPGNLTVGGDLTVNGTTTNISTQNLLVEDKNIEIGKVSTPSDTTADGGGITLKGATDKTINWVDSTDSWTFSEHLDLASGKVLKSAGTQFLSSTQYTGNSATATALATARTIGGVSFDGTANIDLPGVNTVGNQNTTGSAATLTTPRTIAGVSFDGSANISLNNNAITNGAGYIDGSSLNASNLSSGTVPDSRLPTTLPAISGANLTSLNASNLASGTVPDARLPSSISSDITGNAATATALATARTIAGESFDGTSNITLNNSNITNGAGYITATLTNEEVQDIVGGMLTGNTESGITVTYQDSDGTIDFVVGTLNQDTTGNAATATALETARNIGGVSFDGTGNINLPGVNTSGNQDTSGNAATATKLATARTIAGVSFDGSANISLNNNAITNGAGYITATLTNEEVQDIVGNMLSGNTETGITVTYQDSDGTIDFVVASQTDENFTTTLKNKLDGIEAGADVTDAANVNSAGAVMNSDTSTASMNFVVDEDNFSSNSATKVPTQQSVKAYVDANAGGGITSLVEDTSPQLGGDLDTNSHHILLDDNHSLQMGNSNDFQIQHNANENYIDSNSGHIYIRANVNDDEGDNIYIQPKSGEDSAVFTHDGAVELYYDNSKKFATQSSGVTIYGDIDVSNGTIFIRDNEKLVVGNNGDIEIYHNTSINAINLANAFNLEILHNSETIAKFIPNGAVELYHNNSKSLETTSVGTRLYGRTDIGDSTGGATDDRLTLGDSQDLQIYHDSSDSYVDTNTGQLFLTSTNSNTWLRGTEAGILNTAGNEYMIRATSNGSVKLYYNSSIKLETASGGISVTGGINLTTNISMPDNGQLKLGTSDDLKIFHDGSNSRIHDGGTGVLAISGSEVHIQNAAQSENCANFIENGAVKLHYDNSKKLETTSSGVTVTGALTATGNVTAFSDINLKKDVLTINNALSTVGKLRGVSYKWKENNQPSIGVIAQEVEKIIPEVVQTSTHDGKNVKSVDYGKMVGVLIEAIKELKAEVEEFKRAK